MAAHYGVPVLAVSGDEAAVKEVQALVKGVEGAVVKWPYAFQAARTLSPEKSRAAIREAVARGMARRMDIALADIPFPTPFCWKLFGLPYFLSRTGRTSVTGDIEPESFPEVASGAEAILGHILERVRPDPEAPGAVVGDGDAPARARALLEAGAQADAADLLGRTALMFAANDAADHEASLELVRLLLAAGADPDRRSTDGDTALSSATAHYLRDRSMRYEARTLEVVRLLLDAGASDQPDRQGQTLLHHARAARTPKLVELLLARR